MGKGASKEETKKEVPKKTQKQSIQPRPTDGAVGGERISESVKHSSSTSDLSRRNVEEASSESDEGQNNLEDMILRWNLDLSRRNVEEASSESDESQNNLEDVRSRWNLDLPRRNVEDTSYEPVLPTISNERNSIEELLRLRRMRRSLDQNMRLGKEYTQRIIEHKKSNALLVAAIDFGTTYSGYSYSFIEKPEEIMTNYWENASVKTPTVVLMDSRKTLHSFGEEAKRKYEALMKTGEHKRWYLFERFKMKLFVKETPLERDMEIEDILGKPMKAFEVFSAAIKFIRDRLLGVLNDPNRKGQVEITSDNDIRWVLTVPAIWNDLSKRFMREAAVKAGIPDEMLLLALEPEAASLFCKEELGMSIVPVGCKYLVLDLGGGTADITCHEVNKDGTLKELHPPTGGDFGGTSVDNEFLQLLQSIFSGPLIAQYKQHFMTEYWELLKDFELKKRKFDGTGRVNLKFPVRLLEMFEESVEMTVEESLKESTLSDAIEFKQGKLIITDTKMKQFYNTAISQIKKKTEEILENISEEISCILLVGGFSESLYLQKVMKENFYNLIVLPKEPSGAVLKGAVIYGHEAKAISSRKCRYTYGIARMIKFIPGKHPEKKKICIGKFTYCDDAFNKHIEIGTDVSVNTAERAEAHEYFPSAPDQKHAVLEVYKSTKKNPMFVDEDDCDLVGLIKVDIDPKGDIWAKLWVKLIFGGTELKVEVTDHKNAQVTTGTVDFLG